MKKLGILIAVFLLSGCSTTEQSSQLLGEDGTSSSQYVGQVFPETQIASFSSNSISTTSQQTRGKVVNLWASWCEPCKREFPLMAQSKYAQYIVAINVNDLSESQAGVDVASRMVADGNLNVWIDSNNSLKQSLPIVGLPITLAVDGQGRIVDEQIGELSADSLARLVKASQQE
jgi:thiol-disulfide isomerase/thioredoxin